MNYLKAGLIFFFTLLICKVLSASEQKLANNNNFKKVAFVCTSNMQGYLKNCGCESGMLGGIDRLVFSVNAIKKKYANNFLFIDGGNLFFDSRVRDFQLSNYDINKVNLMLKILKSAGLEGCFLSANDYSRGTWIDSHLENYNIKKLKKETDLKTCFLDYKLVKEFDWVKIGIFGFNLDKQPDLDFAKLEIENEIKKSCDDLSVVILFIRSSGSFIKKTMLDFRYANIIINTGDDNEKYEEPVRLGENGPVLISTGSKGQHLGFIKFLFQKNKNFNNLAPRVLEKTSKKEAFLKKKIESIEAKICASNSINYIYFLQSKLSLLKKELDLIEESSAKIKSNGPSFTVKLVELSENNSHDFQTFKLINRFEARPQIDFRNISGDNLCKSNDLNFKFFAGGEACKKCHLSSYKSWKNSNGIFCKKNSLGYDVETIIGHAKAWDALEKTNKDMDKACIGCHSSGFSDNLKSCGAYAVKDKNKNVQCESCHGAGLLHLVYENSFLINKNVSEKTCRSCHRVPHINSFDSFNYETKLNLILKNGHGK